MQNEKLIRISTAGSRTFMEWPARKPCWPECITQISNPHRRTETLQVYMGYTKKQQDEMKDVGGFVGDNFKGNRRKAANAIDRDLITLDLDNIPPGGTDDKPLCGSLTGTYWWSDCVKGNPGEGVVVKDYELFVDSPLLDGLVRDRGDRR